MVLREGVTADEQAIRAFASERLASFKVPRKILVLDEIPKGATGKAAANRVGEETGHGLMKICIFGAGAIGGWLGLQLELAGEDVTLVARGPHLAAMQKNGLKVLIDGEERIANPRCIEDPAEAGPQELCHRYPEGAVVARSCWQNSTAAWRQYAGSDRGERDSLVVLLSA